MQCKWNVECQLFFLFKNNVLIYRRYDWQETAWYHRKNHCTNVTQRSGRVPMIWGWRHINDYPIHVPDDAQTVLIFNEPNFYKQANLSAADAARLWKTEIQPKLAGKTLVGPTAAPCSTSSKCYGDVDEWFLDFFKHCQHCQIDYIATHLYYCNADQTMAKLQHLWNLFQKPIWLTEFACPHSHSVSTQLAYMKAILPRLEAAHFVAKYSWYASRHRDNCFTTEEISLLHHDSSTLNTLGNYYNNFWCYALLKYLYYYKV